MAHHLQFHPQQHGAGVLVLDLDHRASFTATAPRGSPSGTPLRSPRGRMRRAGTRRRRRRLAGAESAAPAILLTGVAGVPPWVMASPRAPASGPIHARHRQHDCCLAKRLVLRRHLYGAVLRPPRLPVRKEPPMRPRNRRRLALPLLRRAALALLAALAMSGTARQDARAAAISFLP